MKRAGEAALWTIIVLATAIILLVIVYLSTAHAEEKINGYTCEDAKRLVLELGKVKALALAIENGLSIRQIWKIRRSCKL